MAWALLLAGVLATAEAFFHMPVLRHVRGMQAVAAKSLRTIASPKISDHHKETVLLAYAVRLLKASFAVLACMLLASLPIAAAVGIGDALGADVLATAMTAAGIAASTVIALAYVWLRVKFFRHGTRTEYAGKMAV